MSPIYLDLLIELKAEINIVLRSWETFEHSLAAHILSAAEENPRQQQCATFSFLHLSSSPLPPNSTLARKRKLF
jgi:hypothetical protein